MRTIGRLRKLIAEAVLETDYDLKKQGSGDFIQALHDRIRFDDLIEAQDERPSTETTMRLLLSTLASVSATLGQMERNGCPEEGLKGMTAVVESVQLALHVHCGENRIANANLHRVMGWLVTR